MNLAFRATVIITIVNASRKPTIPKNQARPVVSLPGTGTYKKVVSMTFFELEI